MKFPKEIFVIVETDADSEYLVASKDLDVGEDGEKVGVYKLVEVKKKKVTEELV